MNEHFESTRPKTAAELHTEAVRDFIEQHTAATNRMARWYGLAYPGTREQTATFLAGRVEEMINVVTKHAKWLMEQGLVMHFQPSVEEDTTFPMVGISSDEETLGYVAHMLRIPTLRK